MTDKEIIKALENRFAETFDTGWAKIQHNELSNLIDLINRQQAEIERLNYIITRDNQRQTEKEQKDGDCILTLYELYDKEIAENKKLKAEIERLKEKVASKSLKCSLLEREKAEDISGFVGELKLAKAEAIKEFADRLKEHLKGNGGLYCVTTMNAKIDNLVKEMVGDDK